jgi:hypothetical protein
MMRCDARNEDGALHCGMLRLGASRSLIRIIGARGLESKVSMND